MNIVQIENHTVTPLIFTQPMPRQGEMLKEFALYGEDGKRAGKATTLRIPAGKGWSDLIVNTKTPRTVKPGIVRLEEDAWKLFTVKEIGEGKTRRRNPVAAKIDYMMSQGLRIVNAKSDDKPGKGKART